MPRSGPTGTIRTTAPASTSRTPLGFFSAARQGRKDDAELGKGLWRRAHDRFHRGLDRYHQVLEGVEDEALYAELLEIANELADALGTGPAGLRRGPAAFAERRPGHPRGAVRRAPGTVQRRKLAGDDGGSGGDAPARRRARPGGGANRCGAAPNRCWSTSADAERRLAEDPAGN